MLQFEPNNRVAWCCSQLPGRVPSALDLFLFVLLVPGPELLSFLAYFRLGAARLGGAVRPSGHGPSPPRPADGGRREQRYVCSSSLSVRRAPCPHFLLCVCVSCRSGCSGCVSGRECWRSGCPAAGRRWCALSSSAVFVFGAVRTPLRCVCFSDLEQLDVASLCCGVIRFLQDLPGPILPSVLQADMIRAVQGEVAGVAPPRGCANPRPSALTPVCLLTEVRDLEDCAQVLRCVASSSSCPAQHGLTLLSVVRHLAHLCLHASRTQLSPRALAESFSPVLFRHAAGSVPLARPESCGLYSAARA